MPERRMGAAVGQDCALLEEVCGWINAKATIPVWAKMTPNITDIAQVFLLSLSCVCHVMGPILLMMMIVEVSKRTTSRYCPLWTFSFGLSLKVFKMRMIGRGFHTLIDVVSYIPPPSSSMSSPALVPLSNRCGISQSTPFQSPTFSLTLVPLSNRCVITQSTPI